MPCHVVTGYGQEILGPSCGTCQGPRQVKSTQLISRNAGSLRQAQDLGLPPASHRSARAPCHRSGKYPAQSVRCEGAWGMCTWSRQYLTKFALMATMLSVTRIPPNGRHKSPEKRETSRSSPCCKSDRSGRDNADLLQGCE